MGLGVLLSLGMGGREVCCFFWVWGCLDLGLLGFEVVGLGTLNPKPFSSSEPKLRASQKSLLQDHGT